MQVQNLTGKKYKRLTSLGIVRALPPSPDTTQAITALYRIQGLKGVPSIIPPLCRETLVFQIADLFFSSVTSLVINTDT